MKKYIFLIAVLGMMFSQSVFAGADTDRICNDTKAEGFVDYSDISVYYPERKTHITTIWKGDIDNYTGLYSRTDSPLDIKLFYVVNIYDVTGKYIEKGALYEYNCTTKTPKQLKVFSSINLKPTQEESGMYAYFEIRSVSNGYILVGEGSPGNSDMDMRGFYVYGLKEKRQMFPMINLGSISGRSDVSYSYIYRTTNSWYYIEVGYPLVPPLQRSSEPYITLYKIDIKNRKITQL